MKCTANSNLNELAALASQELHYPPRAALAQPIGDEGDSIERRGAAAVSGASRRLHVLVLTSTFPRHPGDPQPPFVWELARRLALRFEVHVLAPGDRGGAAREHRDGVEIHRYRYAPRALERIAYRGGMLDGVRRQPWLAAVVPLFLVAQAFAARRLARRLAIDVVHSHWLFPQAACAAAALPARARLAHLATTHGGDVYGLRGGFWRAVLRWTIRRCTAVTAVSAALRDAVRDIEPGTSAHVAPMGVDLTGRFVPPAQPAARAGVLFVGRLVPKKGVDVLVEALALLRDHDRARAVIVGDGPERARLEARVQALSLGDRVTFEGARTQAELVGYYQRAAVFAAPFRVAASGDQEGLGLVSIEAAGCGCPVIASALPAVVDVLGNEDDMVAVPPGDVAALAAAIRAVLEDPSAAAARAARARVRLMRTFDWEIVAERYATIISGLAPSPRAGAVSGGGGD